MNIKVDRAKSSKQALEYNFEKCNQKFKDLAVEEPKKYLELSSNFSPDQPVAKVISADNKVTGKSLSNATKLMARSVNTHENPGRVKLPFAHIKVSFAPEEKLEDSLLSSIGEDVLKGLGYDETAFVMFRHYDEPHPHLHIVSPTINKNGKNIKSSYEGIRSKYVERALEDKYNLVRRADRIKEINGVKKRTWKEDKVVNKYGIESFSNVIRRSVGYYAKEKNQDFIGFSRALSREGISLQFSKRERKKNNVDIIRYGVSYGLDKSKINFQFSSKINFLEKEYAGYKMPVSANKDFREKQDHKFKALNPSGEVLNVVVSRNHLNGVYLTNEPILHPGIPKNDKVPAIKGSKVGSKFSYNGLKELVDFKQEEIDLYIEKGNDNSLEEPESLSKLLYSINRTFIPGIKEALEEGANWKNIQAVDIDYIHEDKLEVFDRTLKEFENINDKELKENGFSALSALDKYSEEYMSPSKATVSLAESFENKDWDKFYEILSDKNNTADTRVIPNPKLVTENKDIRNYIKATFENENEKIIDIATRKPSVAKKSERDVVYATMSLVSALHNEDVSEVSKLVDNNKVNYNAINLTRNNTHWLELELNQKLHLKANDLNIEKTNKHLMVNGYPPIDIGKTEVNKGSETRPSTYNEKEENKDRSKKR